MSALSTPAQPIHPGEGVAVAAWKVGRGVPVAPHAGGSRAAGAVSVSFQKLQKGERLEEIIASSFLGSKTESCRRYSGTERPLSFIHTYPSDSPPWPSVLSGEDTRE